MTKKERVKRVLELLDENYGTDLRCYLDHQSPWQLLVAVMLSPQCTDARVNMVTPALFAEYPDAAALGRADAADVEEIIHSVGFFHSKAKNIIECSRMIAEEYGGEVPDSIEALTGLPGVGRKTANVIRGNIYNEPSIVVDTHVKRISKKLGFSKEDDPEKVEYELMRVLPRDHWIIYNIHIIRLGRTVCTARKPACGECFLRGVCPSSGEKNV